MLKCYANFQIVKLFEYHYVYGHHRSAFEKLVNDEISAFDQVRLIKNMAPCLPISYTNNITNKHT